MTCLKGSGERTEKIRNLSTIEAAKTRENTLLGSRT